MTCKHAKGDPNCGQTVGGTEYYATIQRERQNAVREMEAKLAAQPTTPDAERYVIEDSHREGPHLVLKVRYPNCSKCSYEGVKVLVFLDVNESAALRWRVIDPHFADPSVQRAPSEAPSPAARFPASASGWQDAIKYVRDRSA